MNVKIGRLLVPYDEDLANRVRELLPDDDEIIGKAMFGGFVFSLAGNMAVGVSNEDLMVRVGPDAVDETLEQPHARAFEVGGRPMKGWVLVAPVGLDGDDELTDWIGRGLTFARSLPPKKKKAKT
jgi:TfoX/Sxy family transcriptional regulator of competence genes